MVDSPVNYDVVIVGGRPAGASLALRLGAAGHRVLLLERARFPSEPGVPSAPILYQSALAELDELGVPEQDYRASFEPIRYFNFVFEGHFDTVIEVPEMWGRDYVAGVDRMIFDEVLWRATSRCPTIERREGFAVSDVLRDADGRVCGVIGAERGGPTQHIRARAVVGADGRFSAIARKVGAQVVEQQNSCISTVYYAVWEGVPSPRETAGAQIYATGRGLDVISIPMSGGRVTINTHHRADRVDIHGDAQRYYLETIRSLPSVAKLLANARQTSELIGIKKIANGYREAGGPGWALVGDAVHYKDPADGQGINDAFIGSRLLAESLGRWLAGELSWDAAIADYTRELRAATHPMFVETVARLRRELYDEPPALIIKTLIRWTMTDPAYQRQFLHYLGRMISPTGWNSPKLLAGAALRGIWRDLAGSR